MIFRSKSSEKKMAAPKLDRATLEALAHVETLKVEAVRIGAALADAQTAARTATAELENGLAQLAEAEAQAALTGSPADAKRRRLVIDLRATVEGAAARIRGLSAKSQISADAVAAAKTALSQELVRWQATVFAQSCAEYNEAAALFKSAYERHTTITLALGSGKLFLIGTRQAFLPSANGAANVLNDAKFGWSSNPEMVELHRGLRTCCASVCEIASAHPDEDAAQPEPEPEPEYREAALAE